MQYANLDGQRVEPFKGGRALCPACQSEVLAKCGKIQTHHWAHVALDDCDHFSEPETPWHRAMKSAFRPEEREVVVGRNRADVRVLGSEFRESGVLTLEFQNSVISLDKIQDRQKAYGKSLLWVLNGDTQAKDSEFTFTHKGVDMWWKRFSGKWLRQTLAIHYARLGVVVMIGPNAIRCYPKRAKKCRVWDAPVLTIGEFIRKAGGDYSKMDLPDDNWKRGHRMQPETHIDDEVLEASSSGMFMYGEDRDRITEMKFERGQCAKEQDWDGVESWKESLDNDEYRRHEMYRKVIKAQEEVYIDYYGDDERSRVKKSFASPGKPTGLIESKPDRYAG